MEGNLECVKALLDGGADPALKDSEGRTALAIAQSVNVDGIKDNDEVVAVLTQATAAGAKPRLDVKIATQKPIALAYALRDRLRKDIKADEKAKGVTLGVTLPAIEGMDLSTQVKVKRFLTLGFEKAISWTGFVQGMAALSNTRAGGAVNVEEIAQLDSILLDKAIKEDEHLRALNHPSVSPLERYGVKLLSKMSKEGYMEVKRDARPGEEVLDAESGVGIKTGVSFAALDQALDLAEKQDNMKGLQLYREHNQRQAEDVLFKNIVRCAVAGGVASLICALGDVYMVEVWQPDADIACSFADRREFNVCPLCTSGMDACITQNASSWDWQQTAYPPNTGYPARLEESGRVEEYPIHNDNLQWNSNGEVVVDRLYCCSLQCGPEEMAVGKSCGHPEFSNATYDKCYQPKCYQHAFLLYPFFMVALPLTIISAFIELGVLYYDTLRTSMNMAHAVGLVLWPLDKTRMQVASNLTKAALEVGSSMDPQFGINPRKEFSARKALLYAVLYKGKVGVSKFMVKLLVKKAFTRFGVRRAADAAYSSLATVPVGMLWNGVVARNSARQARLRAIGTVAAIECVDRILPDEGPNHGVLTDEVCKAVIRAIGCAVVAKQKMHPNVELLLRRTHERMIQLDIDVQGVDDISSKGWGRDGFEDVDDREVMLTEFRKLRDEDEEAAGMVFKIFILALVLDGVIVQSELDLMEEVLRALRIGENESDVVHEALIRDAECANAPPILNDAAPIPLPSCRALTVSLRVLRRVLVCTCAYRIQDGVALDLYEQVTTLLDHLHKVHTHLTVSSAEEQKQEFERERQRLAAIRRKGSLERGWHKAANFICSC